MNSICGYNCNECSFFNNSCSGCTKTNGCPFGKKCWIAKYIEVGTIDSFNTMKNILIEEFNSLNIDGMPKINNLFPLRGSYVNLEYTLPSGEKCKLLDDNDVYLGNQVECLFNDNDIKKCFGLLTNMDFILVCEYGEDGTNPEILIYKKR